MKKSSKKKSTAKETLKPVQQKMAPALTSKGKGKNGLVNKQPHAVFDQNDLHFKEREVFG